MAQEASRPQRKRSAVSYAETDEVVSDLSDYDSDFEKTTKRRGKEPPKKKRKVRGRPSLNKPLPKSKIFPFLKLPQEIKDQIYDYCLLDESKEIYLVNGRRDFQFSLLRINEEEMKEVGYRQPHQGIKRGQYGRLSSKVAYESMNRFAPSLLLLNKSIHEEASKLLYRRHTFNFDHPATLYTFCTTIGERNLQLLKSVKLKDWSGYRQGAAWNYTAMVALAGATNLERVVFGNCRYWGARYVNMSSSRAARRVYSLLAPYLNAIGVKSGRMDAAVDVIEFDRSQDDPWGRRLSNDCENEKDKKADDEADEAVKTELRNLLRSK